MTKTLGSIMTKDIVSVSPQQTVKEAAALMSQYNVGSLPVVENGQLRGMITDRDITLRATASGNGSNEKISECMTSGNLVSGSPQMDVHEAAKMMAENQIRRLPVVDQNNVVGMVALGDFATQNIYQNEAGEALTDISKPSKPQ